MSSETRNVLRQIKFIVIAVLAVLVLIVALQNTANVETKLLFATVTMPRAILLFVMLAIGFVIGWLAGARFTLKQD